MKAKASPSQMRRAALQALQGKCFIPVDMFFHEEWKVTLAKIVKDNDLVKITGRIPGGSKHTVYTTRQLAEARNCHDQARG